MSLLKVNEVQNYNGSSLTLTSSTVSTSAQLNTGGNISVTGSINVSDDSTTRSNLGLGSIATQDSSNVTITGGNISNATLGSSVTFPAGVVINHNLTTYSPSAGSASVGTSESYYFQTSITPLSSSNFIYCLCVVNGQDNAGAGRLVTLVKYSTTSGSGGTNTLLGSNAIGSDNSTPTSNMYSGSILNRVTGLTAGTTYYFKLFARKDDGANANSAYINRYVEANPSSIYVWEVQG